MALKASTANAASINDLVNISTITYNANGSNVTNMPHRYQTIYIGVRNYITHLFPSRTGYAFSRWNTSETGISVDYMLNQSFIGSTNMTLYAIWE
jgi:uncharacterized repeat protein (TIGR02543 family)